MKGDARSLDGSSHDCDRVVISGFGLPSALNPFRDLP